MKTWFKRQFVNLVDWFVGTRFFKNPRLWTEKEWSTRSSKEKLWVWYKHHLYIKGLGSAEVDQVTEPLKQLVLYGSIIILTIERLYAMANIPVGATQLLFTVGIICVILWTGNTILQWLIGNKLDNLDLEAWTIEIGNRRNKVFREIREAREKEKWRKSKQKG